MAPRKEQPVLQTARLPTPTDPSIRDAQMRALERRRNTKGRLSTILTDSLREIVGTTGNLGA